jgi:SAM-dependent methyltransferase
MRALLKKSRFLVGIVKAARSLPDDARMWKWTRAQKDRVAAYCAGREIRKLHIGCGHNLMDGWLNSDLRPLHPEVLFLDATERFPIGDNSFDYIYSEHVIQHLPFRAGQIMLKECARILKPGGTMRISTPDLLKLASLLTEPDAAPQKEYTRLASRKYIPDNTALLPAFVVNNFFWDFTHQFVYDPASMRHALERAGFDKITPAAIGQSTDKNLAGLECHGRIVGDAINEFETMIFEASKPRPA